MADAAIVFEIDRAILPYNWGWVESILLGGILSATDPVAVISLLKGMGVCEDLSVLIEGKSPESTPDTAHSIPSTQR